MSPKFISVRHSSRVSVPGKIMVAGEYVVLSGGPWLATTIENYLTVTVTPQKGSRVLLRSCLWDRELEVDPSQVPKSSELFTNLVYEASHRLGVTGYRLEVNSGLDLQHGVGTSSALAVAVFGALWLALKGRLDAVDRRQVGRAAWEFQSKFQGGVSSGYDIETQLTGGAVVGNGSCFQHCERGAESIDVDLGRLVHVFVGGKGAPTPVLTPVVKQKLSELGLWKKLDESTRELVGLLIEGLDRPSAQLCSAVAQLRNLLAEAGAVPLHLDRALRTVEGFDHRWSYKTTGAGGEDAILVFSDQSDLTVVSSVLCKLGWVPLNVAFGGTTQWELTEIGRV